MPLKPVSSPMLGTGWLVGALLAPSSLGPRRAVRHAADSPLGQTWAVGVEAARIEDRRFEDIRSSREALPDARHSFASSGALLVIGACEKGPSSGAVTRSQVAMPASGDESAAPVDAHLVLRSDGSPALEPIAASCRRRQRIRQRVPDRFAYRRCRRRRSTACGGRVARVDARCSLSARSDDCGWHVDATGARRYDGSRHGRVLASRAGDRGGCDVRLRARDVFPECAGGPGVFFAHSMERGELFHSPVPIMYGDRPSATAVAAADSVVVVAFEDPNSERSQIALAMSHTWGHIFRRIVRRRQVVRRSAERPLVALRQPLIAVGWHGKDRSVVARVGTLK